MSNIEELKSEAASLGIKHNASIGEAKLKEKIEAFYAAQETSGPAVKELAEKNDKTQEKEQTQKAPAKNLDPRIAKRLAREKEARKLRIVTIVDNDQRSNNHTTTCVVNCSNEFFDLGTRILPLGEKIEVAQGHLNVLKEVTITLHALDTKTGLSAAKTRKRYSISYEDVQ
jgi:mRNA-degrading endonuclease toxin of MazEF toxin-antitoxin module